jgi:hypothetical protein
MQMPDYYDKPFDPSQANSHGLAEQKRMANAVEYSAHHLGRISGYLKRIAEALEKVPDAPVGGKD